MNRRMIEKAATAKSKTYYGMAKIIGDRKVYQHGFIAGAQWVLDALGKMQPTDAWKEITENKRRAHDENPNL